MPSGEGETWRSLGADVPFSEEREEADGDVEYVFGVDGWRGWEEETGGEVGFDGADPAEAVVAAFAVAEVVGAGWVEVEGVAGEGAAGVGFAEDVEGSDGVSDRDGVLNSAGRTCTWPSGHGPGCSRARARTFGVACTLVMSFARSQ